MPIIIDAPYILELWLKTVPEQTVLFTRLVLIHMLTISVTYSINICAQASGKIKTFQIVEGGIILLNIPTVWLLFRLGFPASVSFLSMIFFSIVSFIAKLFILSNIMQFPIMEYCKTVISRLLISSFYSFFVFVVMQSIEVHSLVLFIFKTILYMLPSCVIIWFIGFQKNERVSIMSLIKSRKTN